MTECHTHTRNLVIIGPGQKFFVCKRVYKQHRSRGAADECRNAPQVSHQSFCTVIKVKDGIYNYKDVSNIP